jgi:glycosyltransferase involved in cell wall biosynthesis
MYYGKTIALILPARNEALSLPSVLNAVPPEIDSVLVVDNGSIDNTASVARAFGATVVSEPAPGYGMACLAGIANLKIHPPNIVAFADADGSDNLTKLYELITPIAQGEADFVIEKRIPVEPQALSHQQRFGNWLAASLIRLFWGYSFSDLGPMRAIRWNSLSALNMSDQNFGWTVEMQIRALKSGLRIQEYPLPYRKRTAGRSKVSRTLRGSVKAGVKILWVIFREAFVDKKPRIDKQPTRVI